LCDEHGIPSERASELKAGLDDAAAIWSWYAEDREDRTRPSDAAKQLRRLAERTAALQGELSGLPEKAKAALALALFNADTRDLDSRLVDPTDPNADGHGQGETIDQVVETDLETVLRVLTRLQGAAEETAGGVGRQSPGQRRDHALRMWMTNVAMLWEEVSETPFSRDAEAGEPVTPAARFCVAAFKPIDPNTPASRVLNEMKHCIKARRGRTGRIGGGSER